MQALNISGRLVDDPFAYLDRETPCSRFVVQTDTEQFKVHATHLLGWDISTLQAGDKIEVFALIGQHQGEIALIADTAVFQPRPW